MAKSYVTKFTDYVAQQRNNLEIKLRAKGLSPAPNASLGSLISSLDDLQKSFTAKKYERDVNLPDFDEMFDNDPLRAVNGGEYKGCAYLVCELDANGNIGFIRTTSTSNGYYVGEKFVISDGTEYTNGTTNIVHKMGESGIYTATDGVKYGLVKVYALEPRAGISTYISPFIECIDDLFIGKNWSTASIISGYDVLNNRCKYYRYVGSNNTVENIFSITAGWGLMGSGNSSNRSLEFVKIDSCVHKFYSNNMLSPKLRVFIDNGIVYGSSATSAVTYAFGSNQTGNGTPELEYLRLPESNIVMTVNINYIYAESLYISDSVDNVNFSSNYMNVPVGISKMHIGSSLSKVLQNMSNLYVLEDVTVSPNAFGKNTSALTLDFSYSLLLTKESVLNLFNNLADRTGKTANILKLNAIQKALVTNEEKAILTNKNWTLS